jgi:multicomponent Na+:H+ antiporter subunit D
MPVTFWCFLIAGLSLVGIPPMGGFLSKWAIASTLIAEGEGASAVVPVVILLISALLTAGYLLPVVVNGFFPGRDFRLEGKAAAVSDPSRWMTVPMICLCCISLITGLFGTQLLEVLL